MRFKIALEKTDEGYAVSVPGLPGCWSQGSTEAEAMVNAQDAIHEYLAARDELLKGAVVREVDVAV
jgi:predicted RNase H-like HicB family nuclease